MSPVHIWYVVHCYDCTVSVYSDTRRYIDIHIKMRILLLEYLLRVECYDFLLGYALKCGNTTRPIRPLCTHVNFRRMGTIRWRVWGLQRSDDWLIRWWCKLKQVGFCLCREDWHSHRKSWNNLWKSHLYTFEFGRLVSLSINNKLDIEIFPHTHTMRNKSGEKTARKFHRTTMS